MAILTDAEYDADLLLAIDDSPAAFVLHQAGAVGFNPATGAATPASTPHNIKGMREELSVKEIGESHGRYEFGDVRFIVRGIDAGYQITARDWIVDIGLTFELVSVELDPTHRVWFLIGREI